MSRRFEDRFEAGRLLAQRLSTAIDPGSTVVLGLPRGGIPVAYEVARSLHVPLDVFLVRKLGVPGQEELAMGAIASGGVEVLNEPVLHQIPVSRREIDAVVEREKAELQRREVTYRSGRPLVPVEGKTVVLVDDGLATGSTMRAAVAGVRKLHPERVIVAVPVGSPEACDLIGEQSDGLLCLKSPDPFYAVGLWYEDFTQTTDDEVRELLARAEHELASGAPAGFPGG